MYMSSAFLFLSGGLMDGMCSCVIGSHEDWGGFTQFVSSTRPFGTCFGPTILLTSRLRTRRRNINSEALLCNGTSGCS